MGSQAEHLHTDHHYGLLTAALIAAALIAYAGVSAILEATTGIDVPFVSWPF
jgi:hypothetical protein